MPKSNYNIRLDDKLIKAIEIRAYVNNVGFTTQIRNDLETLYGIFSDDERKVVR